jgi:cyclopropane fatty-acyl-phospholipid synthase-like methyltransferase
MLDDRLVDARFPRSAAYHPDWMLASASGGANPLWLVEWLTSSMELRPGMRVLDLGCGRAMSSIFLSREFGVQVWAVDLWFSASENFRRIRDAGVEDRVFPIHADARSLPFASGFFDAITCVDSMIYYGTDDLYLNSLGRFVRPGGQIGMVGAGFTREIDGVVPETLRAWWTPDLWCLHSAEWWSRHWARTGLVEIETADAMPDGWTAWLDWHRTGFPDNTPEIEAVEADRGETLTYVRVVARRSSAEAPASVESLPESYTEAPLLREAGEI